MNILSLAGVRRALVVAPHPDDETIGAYGLIRALMARSARVKVVVVTDGAGSHRNSARWPKARLVAQRRMETLRVMRHVGVTAADVTFLGLPDGGLSDGPTAAVALRRMTRAYAYDMIVLPAQDDDHPDHCAVAAALCYGAGRRIEYLVWPNRRSRSRRATHVLHLAPLAAAKRGAIRRYRSQLGMITDDPGGFAISRSELARFARPAEFFREIRR